MKPIREKGNLVISLWNALGVIVILGFIVRDHAEVVEVSKTIWGISNIWGILFWIFIPLTPIGAFVISSIQEKIERRKNRLE